MKTYFSVNYSTLISTVFILMCTTLAQSQTLNNNWKQSLDESLKSFMACKDNGAAINPCSKYVGESVNTVYQVNDFYSQKLGRYMLIEEIAEYLKGDTKWKTLGKAFNQDALKEAQQAANSKKGVVAIYLNSSGVGHMALILPGELQPSGSWGMSVPNSASFLLSDSGKSYVAKGLSYAFPRNVLMDVLLYVRN